MITYSRTPQRNLLDGFNIGDVTPEIKEKSAFIESHLRDHDLHLVRGASGPEYLHSTSRRITSQVLGTGALLATSPLLLGSMAATKIDDRTSPVIYKGDPYNCRVGSAVFPEHELSIQRLQIFGRDMVTTKRNIQSPHITPVRMWKGRTMKPGADKNFVVGQKAEQTCADQLTKPGRTQRRYKLDELPQFFNTATGDLSHLGTRPIMQIEAEESIKKGSLMLEALGGSKHRVLEYFHETYNPLPKSPVGFVELVHHQELNSVADYEWRIAADKLFLHMASRKLELYTVPAIAKAMVKGSTGNNGLNLSETYQLAA